jgi:hypothetical protein
MKMSLEAYHDYLLQLKENIPADKVLRITKKPAPKVIVKKRIAKTFRKK